MANRGRRQQATSPIAREMYPELNALFYTADPVEFFTMKIDSMTLMMASEEDLTPICEEGVEAGRIKRVNLRLRSKDLRIRYVSSESILVLHHAAETLLRMFFSHVESPNCPWIGIAKERSFANFKRKVDRCLKEGFTRGDVANVFLGGENVLLAGIELSDEKFEECIDGFILLLESAGKLFLEDAYLYNSAKHGLAAIPVKDATVRVEGAQGSPLTVFTGDFSAYLHETPSSQKGGGSHAGWQISYTGQSAERNLALINLITIGLSNIWAVAKRKYIRSAGELTLLPLRLVEDNIYGPIVAVGNQLDTLTENIPTGRGVGQPEEKRISLRRFSVPNDWNLEQEAGNQLQRVLLPSVEESSTNLPNARHFLAFSPTGIPENK